MKNLIYPRQNGKPLMALLMALFLFSCGSDEPDATDPDTPDLVCKAESNDNCQEIFLTNAGIGCPDGLARVSERCTGERLATCDNGAGIRWEYFGYDDFQLASERQTCESMGRTWTSQNDPPVSFGVNVTTPAMSVTTESGRRVTFTLVLTGQPTANVVITPTSSDTGEGRVSGALLFTSGNWNTPQRVTVTGVNDDIADGNQSYQITFRVSSEDTNYNNFSLDPVNVTNTDNNTPGITLILEDSTTSESDDDNTGTIRLVLNTQPTANVVITPTSSNTGEGTVSGALTFTTSNWGTEQQVTVTGVDDAIIDGNQSYQITFTVISTDANYRNFTLNPAGMTNTDNDTGGVTLTPIDSPTTESGGTVTFNVMLNAPPTADVTITLASSDTGEGTVSPETLTFTTSTWNTAQQVTVTGVNDDIDDGDQSYRITFTVMSDDTNYSELVVSPVDITNTDDDTPTFMVAASPAGNVGEDVGTVTYTVSLSNEPLVNVTVDYTIAGTATRNSDYMLPILTTSMTSMTTALSGTLSFTPANWNTDQTITLPIVNDSIAEDNENITFTLSNPTGGAEFPSQASSLSVTTTIEDNDVRGVKIDTNPMMTGDQNTLTVTEGSSTGGTYTVVLTSQPTGNVRVIVGASAIGDVLVMVPASSTSMTEGALTFTPGNWDTAQTVTVTAADDTDLLNDPDVTLTHTVRSFTDTTYDFLPGVPSVVVTIVEDDKATFTVAGPGMVTEGLDMDGNEPEVTYTVSLSNQPTEDVTVKYALGGTATLASGDYTFPMLSASMTTGELTFTPINWETDQPITLTIGNDSIAEDNKTIIFTLSNPRPDGSAVLSTMPSVTTTIVDDDMRGVVVSDTTLSVMEGSLMASDTDPTYTVRLATQPTADVMVRVASSDDLVMVSIPSTSMTTASVDLTFNASNWDTPQRVIVAAGEDDDDAVSDIVTLTNTAMGGGYTTESATVTVTVTENDTATFMVTGPMGNMGEALEMVPENVGTVPYTVSLSARPARDVTVKYALGGDATLANGDYMVSMVPMSSTSLTTSVGGRLTFTAGNWNTPQTITLTIVDDMIDENDETITFTLSEPTGGAVLSRMPLSVTTTIEDDDTRGVKIDTDPMMTGDQNTLTVPEGSLTGGTYTVVLTSQPTGDVTVKVGVSGGVGDVLVMAPMSSTSMTTAPSLTFTTSNWNMPQTVRVTMPDNDIDAADASVTLTHTVSGADYGGRVTPPSVMVTITDDDTRGVTVSKNTLAVLEGDQATYTVVLDSQPTGDVMVAVMVDGEVGGVSGDVSVEMPPAMPTEALTTPPLLTFTTSNWNTPQTVTVVAADDSDTDLDASVTLEHTVTSEIDTNYNSVMAASVTVYIIENDKATFSVTGPSSVKENVGMATYTVSLSAQPTRSVKVDYMFPVSSDSMTTARLEFTTDDWNTAQTVNVPIVDDRTDEGDKTITFTLSGPPIPLQAALLLGSSSVTTTIIDLPSSVEVSFGIATYTVPEGMMFGVVVTLNKDPRCTVTIPLTTMDGTGVTSGDYTFPTSVTFESGETEKAVTFMATDDNDDENRERVNLGFGTPPSGVTVQMVSGSPSTAFVEILDND